MEQGLLRFLNDVYIYYVFHTLLILRRSDAYNEGSYDKMAAKNKQRYYFVFVREDGAGLKRISEMIQNRKIEPSVDKIYNLSEVNQALAKVAGRGSKGKTIIKIC